MIMQIHLTVCAWSWTGLVCMFNMNFNILEMINIYPCKVILSSLIVASNE